MRDVGDEKQVKARADKNKAAAEGRARAIHALCQHREGRDFLWWILEAGSPYASSMRRGQDGRFDAGSSAYAMGWHDLGALILQEVMEASPNGYILMLSENRNVKTLENMNERSDNTE